MPTRELFENSRLAKDWLSKIIYDSSNLPPDAETLDALKAEFSYDGQPIYGSLNFANQTQYETFLQGTNNGTVLNIEEASRFWADKKIAATKARNGSYSSYSYGYDDNSVVAVRAKNVDHMHGMLALVIRIVAPDGKCFTARDMGFTDDKGQAVALLAGSYKMHIVETFEPFIKTVNKGNFKEKFLSIKSIGEKHFYGNSHEFDYDRTLFKHILKHYEEFDYDMSNHLFQLMLPILDNSECEVHVGSAWHHRPHNSFDTSSRHITIDWTIPEEFFLSSELLYGSDHKKFDERIIELLRTINREFRDKTADVDWHHNEISLNITPSILVAIRMENFEHEVDFYDYLTNKIRQTIQRLNSYEETKRINKITDSSEKRDAIQRHGKRMANAMDVLGRLVSN